MKSFLSVFLWATIGHAALRKEELTFTWEAGSPNGQTRNMILTNGQFPGPNLVFDEGDQVEVTVHNRMHQNTTVHWHGILMQDTPWSDGVPGLSQKPIEPGESYVYRFTAFPPGQYWYHSHSRATLLDGLYGSIFIRRKPGTLNPFHMISEDPDDVAAMERAANDPVVIVASDWSYYNSSQYKETFAKSQLQIFCVDSILINGKGSVFCPEHQWLIDMQLPFHEKSWPNNSITDKGCFPFVPSTEGPWLIDGDPSVIPFGMQEGCVKSWGSEEIVEVDPQNKWVGINWIGASTFKTLQPSIDEHEMWIYEVDGHYIEPVKATTMLLWAGERYSAMIKLDRRPMDYSIRVIDGGYSQMIGSFGRLRYKGGERDLVEPDPWFNVTTTSMPWFGYNAWPVLQTTMLDKDNLVPWPAKVPARHSDEMHLLQLGKANSTWEFTLGGKKKYPSDRSAYKPLLYNLGSSEANDEDLVIRTKNESWVDIVLQVGQDPMWPVDFPHPIHKHANKYWRIGSGDGIWNYESVDEAIATEPANFNLENPPYRDTFLTDFQGAMWVVLRYQVTTPGAWLLHCHIELHLDNGMAMAILDGVDAWPEGSTASWDEEP
ncbi:multicopper oxidase [Zasmidium cellare ATCC 36951]|uniref:Multicopper oxidase n=1 Tax=Zasmidium cellare ATCC 36951 TaxID=1080233 RepID=A0A6A6CJN5_ZASCE|nr:multicopper oxidase [Zasmidium cellare ATCC 36951]KAF2166408.1 multicopper oxidase [Zasmidium cellare ATCC 36951]